MFDLELKSSQLSFKSCERDEVVVMTFTSPVVAEGVSGVVGLLSLAGEGVFCPQAHTPSIPTEHTLPSIYFRFFIVWFCQVVIMVIISIAWVLHDIVVIVYHTLRNRHEI